MIRSTCAGLIRIAMHRIGEGKIGADALVRVVKHPALQGLPCILETPNELDGYAKEIAFFRDAVRG